MILRLLIVQHYYPKNLNITTNCFLLESIKNAPPATIRIINRRPDCRWYVYNVPYELWKTLINLYLVVKSYRIFRLSTYFLYIIILFCNRINIHSRSLHASFSHPQIIVSFEHLARYVHNYISYLLFSVVPKGAYSSHNLRYVLRRRLCTMSLRPMVASLSLGPASATLVLKVVFGGTVAVLVDRLWKCKVLAARGWDAEVGTLSFEDFLVCIEPALWSTRPTKVVALVTITTSTKAGNASP